MEKNKAAVPDIWCCASYDNCWSGYLITEAGNLDRPIAYVDTINGSVADGFSVAKYIRDCCPAEPWRAANKVEGIGVVDLTHYGHPDSRAALPGFVFGLRCTPSNGNGEELDVPDREPRPWCRFMEIAMTRQRLESYREVIKPESSRRVRQKRNRQPARKAVRK